MFGKYDPEKDMREHQGAAESFIAALRNRVETLAAEKGEDFANKVFYSGIFLREVGFDFRKVSAETLDERLGADSDGDSLGARVKGELLRVAGVKTPSP